MTALDPNRKPVLSKAEATEYLSLPSERSLDGLVAAGRLTPLRICKQNVFAKSELDALVIRELVKEQRLRGAEVPQTAGNGQP